MKYKSKKQRKAVMAALKKGDVVRTQTPIRDIGIYQKQKGKNHIVIINKGKKKIKVISKTKPKLVRGRKL